MTIRAAVYAHSFDSPLNDQILTTFHHADEQDIFIVATYTDFGSFPDLESRPGLHRLVEDARQGILFNTVLVQRPECLSRGFELIWYNAMLRSYGVTLKFVNQTSVKDQKLLLEQLMHQVCLYESLQSDSGDAM